MNPRRPIIRHIATSFDGSVAAFAEFEHSIQIWDIHAQKRITSFESTLDFGGQRLAISRDGKHCVVGAYVNGIALYDAETGVEIWRRKDLKKVQTICISKDGQRVLCEFEGRSFEPLNLKNGRSKLPLRGVERVWESCYDPVRVVERKKRDYQLVNDENQVIAVLPRKSFAALSFAFAPRKVCVSESGGPVRCFDIGNGKQLWDFYPAEGAHALDLAFNESANQFAALTWPYRTGGDRELLGLEPETGLSRHIATITGVWEQAFCCKGSLLLTSDGRVRDVTTGATKALLAFFPTSALTPQ